MQIVSRKEARRLGLPHYFTGDPCCNGHLSPRNTQGKQCLACHREARAIVRATQPQTVKAQKAAYYQRHRDEVIAKVIAYQHSRPEWDRARRQRYRDRKAGRIAAAH